MEGSRAAFAEAGEGPAAPAPRSLAVARSSRLSLRDVRAVFRLVGECRELGPDVAAWRRHLIAGLCQLTRAQVGLVGELEYSRQAWLQPLHSEDVGWACPADRHRVFEQFIASGLYGRDLSAERFFGKLPLASWTVRREQIIPDREWRQAVVFNDFIRRGGLDLGILSRQPIGRADRANVVVLYHCSGEAPLPERGRRLVQLAQQELGPLLGTALAVAGEPGWSALPPRWRQALDCLLDGDSEKQAALRLGISRTTLHDYVRGLYRHFGVSSRGELLAFFLRRYGPSRPWRGTGQPPRRDDGAREH
jgi:DNA-binding CsgD family transcriptional regulator